MDTNPSQGIMKILSTAAIVIGAGIIIAILGMGLLLALFLTAVMDIIQSIKDSR
jgi:hypothetical protein